MNNVSNRNGNSSDCLLIGVDAGGSKTLAWVENAETLNRCELSGDGSIQPGDKIATGISGPGNVRAVGFEVATSSIAQAIDAALNDYQSKRSLNASDLPIKLCLSAAGAGREGEKRQLCSWARERFTTDHVVVTDDAMPVLAAVSIDCRGVALICGTGAYAWGRSHKDETQRCGGWGYLFGDEGSGYAIGIETLRAVARASDGRGESTALAESCCRHLEINDPAHLIPAIYGKSVSRDEIARLAELVFEVWKSDSVANQIIQNAAQDNALLINTITQQLSFDNCQPSLALAGGVLVQQPEFRDEVIRRIHFPFDQIDVVPNPVLGAIKMAAKI